MGDVPFINFSSKGKIFFLIIKILLVIISFCNTFTLFIQLIHKHLIFIHQHFYIGDPLFLDLDTGAISIK